jgi:hypothetical protein
MNEPAYSSNPKRLIEHPNPQLRVGGSLIRLHLPDRDSLTVEPVIRHRSRMDFHGFGRLESYEYGRLQHRVEAVILPESLDQWARAGEARNPPTWEDLLKLNYREPIAAPSDEDPAFVVGRLEIEEHPRITRWRLQSSWGDWLRSIDIHSAFVGDVLDQLEESREGKELLHKNPLLHVEGSLFHIRSVAVHPAFYGQAVRRRLIAHTLWAMHRGIGDVAIILVYPSDNALGPEGSPDQSVAATRQLTRYYQRMGFTRSLRGRIVAGRPVPMHVFFGAQPLRVSGLHEIGVIE